MMLVLAFATLNVVIGLAALRASFLVDREIEALDEQIGRLEDLCSLLSKDDGRG